MADEQLIEQVALTLKGISDRLGVVRTWQDYAPPIVELIHAAREAGRVEGARAGLEVAEQRCRYLLKHQNFGVDTGEYASGFEVACELSEQTIRALNPEQIAKEIKNG